MRSPRSSRFRLTFVLPRGARALPCAVVSGWVPDCELTIAGPFVAILAPSRERAMEQAARLIRITCYQLSRVELAAIIESPPPCAGKDGPKDSWTIVVNADIAFVPTGLGAVFPELSDAVMVR